MGMDLTIVIAKSTKELESNWQDWYNLSEIQENSKMYNDNDEIIYPTDHPINAWYARKFADLVDKIPELYASYKEPCVVRVYKGTLKKMIDYHAFNPDYFGHFTSLPTLCELYQEYDNLQAQGLNLYFINSY